MATKKNCIVCGKEYEFCIHCAKNGKKETWRSSFCSENCRDIFRTCSDYVGKMITIPMAQERLNKLDLNIKLQKSVNATVAEILAYQPNPTFEFKREVQGVDAVEIKDIAKKEEIKTEENTIEEQEQRYKRSRRRRNKFEEE